jgi:hypothetical protein
MSGLVKNENLENNNRRHRNIYGCSINNNFSLRPMVVL